MVGAVLEKREMSYVDRDGRVRRREIHCGVPQGSVLGPLLWNLGYDRALQGAFPRGIRVTCYANDTLLVAAGVNGPSARRLAACGAALLVQRIEELGLHVALKKTEAMWLHGPRRRPPAEESTLLIQNVAINIGATMNYLGLVLDSRWQFGPHFRKVLSKALRVAGSMARLLPNMKGPKDGARRLYAGVIRSVALYGAPIWHGALARSRDDLALMRRTQRTISARVARAYRTVAGEAACALAGTMPWDIVAGAPASAYEWRSQLRARGIHPTSAAKMRRRAHEEASSRAQ